MQPATGSAASPPSRDPLGAASSRWESFDRALLQEPRRNQDASPKARTSFRSSLARANHLCRQNEKQGIRVAAMCRSESFRLEQEFPSGMALLEPLGEVPSVLAHGGRSVSKSSGKHGMLVAFKVTDSEEGIVLPSNGAELDETS